MSSQPKRVNYQVLKVKKTLKNENKNLICRMTKIFFNGDLRLLCHRICLRCIENNVHNEISVVVSNARLIIRV